MKKTIILTFLLITLCMTADPKKGIGCPSGCTASTLTDLGVSWFYNWNSYTSISTSVKFIPMCFSGKKSRLDALTSYDQLLGFNEPDNDNQANMTVDEAYGNWSILDSKTVEIASPVMASNAAASGSWLELFMAKTPAPNVDYIAVHWYGGNYTANFKNRMQDIYNKYQKPLWITQFACQTVSSATADPNKYSTDDVNKFLDNVIPWIQNQTWIYRYAWHDAKSGSSAFWYPDGTLTATGAKYASF